MFLSSTLGQFADAYTYLHNLIFLVFKKVVSSDLDVWVWDRGSVNKGLGGGIPCGSI